MQKTVDQNPFNDQDSLSAGENQRLANFLSLANLKTKVPPKLFQELERQINQSQDLPKRVDWQGQPQSCSFAEFELISGQAPSPPLTQILRQQRKNSTKFAKVTNDPKKEREEENPLTHLAKTSHYRNFGGNPSRVAYISNFKNRNQLGPLFQNQIQKSKHQAVTDVVQNQENSLYHRLKTVFGHAIISEGSGASVYNCKFDMSGKFIITGADDGIIKVWNKDNMILQASLHGHREHINDIAVSKCNRFMASGSKDGVLILWDMMNCTIIKRITDDHTAQINRLKFVMMKCSQKQANKNFNAFSQNDKGITDIFDNIEQEPGVFSLNEGALAPKIQECYDQFLISCSDDGSINIYDVSTFTSTGNEEFYVKSAADNKIFVPIQKKSATNSGKDSATINELKTLITQEDEEMKDEDNVTRRTRKRRLGNQQQSNPTTANTSSQSQPNNSQNTEIFKIKLRSEEFRAGTRNKHIDAFSVCPRGFVVGGTNHGEIFMWKVDFNAIRLKKMDKLFVWVNSFKVSKRPNHYLQFDLTGNFLMCGSDDGTTSLFNTQFTQKVITQLENIDAEDTEEEIQPKYVRKDMPLKLIDIGEKQLIHKFEEKSQKYRLQGAIDSIEWSVNGRYAFVAMNIKKKADESENKSNNKEEDNSQAIVKVKVYDTYSGTVIQNLNRACNYSKRVTGFSSIMKAHPFNEDILLVCYDNGLNVIYDVRQRQIVQEIVEYGIYSIDQFCMNNQMDVDFSPDGDFIAMSSTYGTVSLYSTQAHLRSQYQCTRVQQFFPYDNENHDGNIFETLGSHPQLCGYELNPYEVQPPPPIIGRYRRTVVPLSSHEFYRQQLFAREFALEEENFYINQLRDGMRQGYFEQGIAQDVAREENEQRLLSFAQQSSLPQAAIQDDHMESDIDLIAGPRTQRRRRNATVRNTNRRLTRTDEQPEEVEESDDETFNQSQSHSQSQSENSNEDDFMSHESDLNNHIIGGRNYQSPIRRQNYHNHPRQRQPEIVIESTHDQEDEPVRRGRGRGRPRQNQNRFINSQSTNRSPIQSQPIQRQRRRGVVVHSGETSQNEERPDDESDFGGPRRNSRRTRGRPNRGNFNDDVDMMSSEEPSAQEFSSNDDEAPRRHSRLRNSRGQRISSRPNYDDEESSEAVPQQRNRIQAQTRRNLRQDDAEVQSFQSFQSEESAKFDKNDEQIEKFITVPSNTLERDDSYSVRGSTQKKKGRKILKEGKFSATKNERDVEYEIDNTIRLNGPYKCKFCERQIDKDQETGPFTKKLTIETSIEENEGPLFFHVDCLKHNQYVKYDTANNQWLNIGTALKNLVHKKQFTCYRCLKKGATVQCSLCLRAFHGYHCQSLYLLQSEESQALSESEANGKEPVDNTRMCIFCTNFNNYMNQEGEQKKQIVKFAKKNINKVRHDIPRDHLINSNKFKQKDFFVPQIGDNVVYFWQGHEQFVQSNNCFFYEGTQKIIGSSDLPWMHHQELKSCPNGVDCQVVSINHKFANVHVEWLLDQFGDTSFPGVQQRSQVVSYVRLITQSFGQNNFEFVVVIFPSQVQNFLVPKFLFDQKMVLYSEACMEGKLHGKLFKNISSGNKVIVIHIKPLEPELDPAGVWMNLLVKDIVNNAPGRGSRGRFNMLDIDENTYRLNFWQLVYPQEEHYPIQIPAAFDIHEQNRMVDCLTNFFTKKHDLCFAFMDRVGKEVASDYKSFVSAEMWLNLINERIINGFYRTQDQLWSDFDLIPHCSHTYNSEFDDLTEGARQMVEKVRRELKTFINQNNEKVLKKIKDFKVRDHEVNNVNNFGFTTDTNENKSPTPNKSLKVTIELGDGGESIKELLNTNMDKTEYSQRAQLIEQLDGTSIILIDPKVPALVQDYSTENVQPAKRRGRPPKKAKAEDQNFTIQINQDKTFECPESSDEDCDNDVIIPRSRQKRGATLDDSQEDLMPKLGKRTYFEFQNESSFTANNEFIDLCNQENQPINTRSGGSSMIQNEGRRLTRRQRML